MKVMIRQELANLIKEVIKGAGLNGVDFSIEHPDEKTHGDYATNVALLLKKNPQEIANAIKSPILEKIEVKNGFINFFISKDYLQKQVGQILKGGQDYGKINPPKFSKEKIRRVNIEFISANPTGQLHVGNGRNAFFGDVLANVLEMAGLRVVREYFINDAKNSKQIMELGKTALGRGETYLTEKLKIQISRLRQCFGGQAKLQKLSEGEAGYKLAQIVQKETQDFLGKKLKIKFDKWVSEEKDLYQKNKIQKMLDWLKKNNLVYQKEGALWLKSSQFGDEKDWVVLRETGEPTYLLSDIAYHKDKFDRGFNKIIDIWGADHQAHVSKIKAAAKILGFKDTLDILVLQLVSLKGGEKMSKRAGNIITLEELIDEIGLDAARWFYLQRSLNTHTEIDLELAKEQSEKNPVFYVQYAHARVCSILRKVSGFRFCPCGTSPKGRQVSGSKLLNHESELNLIKHLIRFPEIIEDTAADYQVQRFTQYAVELAAAFHQFYRDCKVLSGVEGLQEARLSLVSAVKIVLKNTLSLMGISAPEKM